MKRLIVGLSGASGAIYGIRLLELLQPMAGLETHLIISQAARRTIQLETDYTVPQVEALAHTVYPFEDITASLSSGSYKTMGMVVAPCSAKTLAGIATGYTDNLLLRAADVALKERRKLILMVRETPLHLGHVRLMAQVIEMGAIVMPPVPVFYHRPQTVDEIINQTVNRLLDLLEIELEADLFQRWGDEP